MPRLNVIWFGNDHDHFVHYFKYGLMKLARDGEIHFREIPNDQAGDLLPPQIRDHRHRRTAAVRIDDGTQSRILILDGEDSIFQLSPLIQWCDLYFSCTYRRKFFEWEPFDLELPWQTEGEISHYRNLYYKLQNDYRDHLHKARPLMPMGPAMEWTKQPDFIRRKAWGARHKFSKLFAPWIDWGIQCARFEKRWEHLHQLRELEPVHDVVLKDSLWGWPRHRLALHRKLADLSDRYDIRSELHYRSAQPYELGGHLAPNPDDFPMISGGGVQGDYEEAIARSRLGVFATGFHYGCRNIVTLAWFLGLPTLSDPFSFESIYDFSEVGVEIHRSGSWEEIPEALETARCENKQIRIKRQQRFDEIADPIRGARWILNKSMDKI